MVDWYSPASSSYTTSWTAKLFRVKNSRHLFSCSPNSWASGSIFFRSMLRTAIRSLVVSLCSLYHCMLSMARNNEMAWRIRSCRRIKMHRGSGKQVSSSSRSLSVSPNSRLAR